MDMIVEDGQFLYMSVQCLFYTILTAGPAFIEQSSCKEKLKKVPDLAFEIIKVLVTSRARLVAGIDKLSEMFQQINSHCSSPHVQCDIYWRQCMHCRSINIKLVQSCSSNFARVSRDDKFRLIDNDGNVCELAAHKFLLAGTSEVLRFQKGTYFTIAVQLS